MIWLLDGHYSHLYGEALRYLKDHDVHVFFTASGSSEKDQVADCGVMAHLQASFADAMAAHLAANPGIPFLPGVCVLPYCLRLAYNIDINVLTRDVADSALESGLHRRDAEATNDRWKGDH